MNVTYIVIGVLGAALMAAIFLLLVRRGRAGDVALTGKLELLERAQERSERMLREEMARSREEGANAAKTQREELTKSLEAVRSIVDLRLTQLQEDNSRQIDKMRATVDEKLQGTLETLLGDSFSLV
jgi:DNA recombination protein RmuC